MSKFVHTPYNTRSKGTLDKTEKLEYRRNRRRESFDKYCVKRNLQKVMEKETIENLQREIDDLRQLNNMQREEINRLREQNQTQNRQNDNDGTQAINNIVAGLRVLNIDSKMPKYDDNQTKNPNEFLNNLNRYFTIKQINDEHRLLLIENALEGRAKMWYETNRDEFMDYEQFKAAFLKEFFSIPIRVKIKSRWSARRFEPGKSTLQSYFLSQYKEAQYFLPIPEVYEINYSIIQQLPIRVREALTAIDYSEVNKVTQALAHLDLTHEERENSRKRQQAQNQSSNNENTNFKSKGSQFQNTKQVNEISTNVRSSEFTNASCGNCQPTKCQSRFYSSFPSSNSHFYPHSNLITRQSISLPSNSPVFPDFSIPPPNMVQNGNFHYLN